MECGGVAILQKNLKSSKEYVSFIKFLFIIILCMPLLGFHL